MNITAAEQTTNFANAQTFTSQEVSQNEGVYRYETHDGNDVIITFYDDYTGELASFYIDLEYEVGEIQTFDPDSWVGDFVLSPVPITLTFEN